MREEGREVAEVLDQVNLVALEDKVPEEALVAQTAPVRVVEALEGEGDGKPSTLILQ